MGGRSRQRRSPGGQALPPLLPAPKRVRRRAGSHTLTSGTTIALPAEAEPLDRSLLRAAERLRSEIADRAGLSLEIERTREPAPERLAIRCVLDAGAALAPRRDSAPDAYRLDVRAASARGRGGIEVRAPGPAGLRHGLQTLGQLIDRRGRVPAVEILDQPDFRDRGLMLDVSRGRVPTRQTLERLVDLCGQLRLNVLMLYVEHTFDFRGHPQIGEGASPLDARTLLALDAYASDRGVELVPCLQSLGHMEHILSLDRYAELAESDRRWSLSPSHPGTYAFLAELYDEYLPLFRSRRFNANCDEPFDLGRGQSAERAPRKTPGRLFADHVSRLERLAARHDKQLLVWADFALKHPEEIGRIDRDVVLLDWWYEPEFDFDRIGKLRRRGFEVWACPGTSGWNALFPRIGTATENIARWADAGRRHGAKGLLNTDWGDFGHYNTLGGSLHAYAWGAQQAWSGELDPTSFDRAFSRHVYGDARGRIGRLYRQLGKIQDAGFRVANGSGLQYVYFDGLTRSFFLQHVRRPVLERGLRQIGRVREALAAIEAEAPSDPFLELSLREIAWAVEATELALEKGLAALDYNDWRAAPGTLGARDRRRLAKRLAALSGVQRDQRDRLESLWLERSAISEFHKTRRRLDTSLRELATAARRLEQNRPPRPPAENALTMMSIFNEMRRVFGLTPR